MFVEDALSSSEGKSSGISTSKLTHWCEESDLAAKALQLYISVVMGCNVQTMNGDEREIVLLGKARSCS